MTYELLPLFSTPLYVTEVDIDDEYLESIKNYSMSLPAKTLVYNDNDQMVGSEERNILNLEEFSLLKKKIQDNIHEYIYKCLEIDHDYYINESWLMYSQGAGLNTETIMHYHSKSTFTGIFYIENLYDEGGDLLLDHAITKYNYNIINYTSKNVLNSSQWYIKPKRKMLVLFPSYLPHKVTKSMRYLNHRISLPFDIDLVYE